MHGVRRTDTATATIVGRFPVLDVHPAVEDGRWPAKAFEGEYVPFRMTSFREGHDALGAILELVGPDGHATRHRMRDHDRDFDIWRATARVGVAGMWSFRFVVFADDYATWLHDASIKIPLGIDIPLMLEIGRSLFERCATQQNRSESDRAALTACSRMLADDAITPEEKLRRASEPTIAALLETEPATTVRSVSSTYRLLVERLRAGCGAWYEMFPRSVGARWVKSRRAWRSGTLRTAAKDLPRIAGLGFDVVYLPPIHPIGVTNRKGRDNSLDCAPGDPGSPWAIGSEAGGHDAIHPDLGRPADFRAFVRTARGLGMEVALDLALQASPDHPWVNEHPEWFTTLPDGSIAFAENPPKKYQDIYPINFDNDPVGLEREVLRIVEYWISQGVTIFRVDNPHTKPPRFWEWLIRTVCDRHPGTVFLAEAFTRPAVMQTLAKIGFQLSYTYYTWRNTAGELADYLGELSHETCDFLRPMLFPTTPDILTEYIEYGGVGASKVRAAIAATSSPSWGMYSGFELLETEKRSDAEEPAHNEKYEYRPRDFTGAEERGEGIQGYIRMLNRVRHENRCLWQLRNLIVHSAEDPAILVFSKRVPADAHTGEPENAIIVVADTAPHSVIETMVHLDLSALGLPADAAFDVTDQVTGAQWHWGAHNYVRLDMDVEPAHILRVDYPRAAEEER